MGMATSTLQAVLRELRRAGASVAPEVEASVAMVASVAGVWMVAQEE